MDRPPWNGFPLVSAGRRAGDLRCQRIPGVHAELTAAPFQADAIRPTAAMVAVLGRAWVYFTVGDRRFRLPLAATFVLIGSFVWLAENIATFLGAWQYPDQADGWTIVHASKVGSWSLLVSLSFALVATVKATEGRWYGQPGTPPSVVTGRALRRTAARLVRRA